MTLDLIQAARSRSSKSIALFSHLGALGLFLFAILDSSPVPTFGGADILLILLVATRPHPWYEFAGAALAGSVIGAYITFRMARHAGRQFLYGKFRKRGLPKLLGYFEKWGTGTLVASTAIPFPAPTGVFFAAAGASNRYSSRKFLTIVTLSRGVRYSAVALIAHLYGRHIIRVLRHPTQHWGWFALFAIIFVAIVATGFLLNKHSENTSTRQETVQA